MTDYISRDNGKIAAWQILESMGYSSKHNDRLVEEVEAVFDEIPAAFTDAQIGEIPLCDVRFAPANVQALDENGLPFFGNHAERIKRTHGDNFRAMTDEELAVTFSVMSCCEENYPNCYKYNINGGGRDCVKCWTDFLKAEAKE